LCFDFAQHPEFTEGSNRVLGPAMEHQQKAGKAIREIGNITLSLFLENYPSLFITSIETLLLGPSPQATTTPTFSPTASDISATSLCVNPGPGED
jgi:hypothetical protein